MRRLLGFRANGREMECQPRVAKGSSPWVRRAGRLGLVAALLVTTAVGAMASSLKTITFDMARSGVVVKANVLPNARAEVRVISLGPVEVMDVEVSGLPPKTDFDFFVIQVPDAPFGLSWYQGDIETNEDGRGCARFVGRFSIETFAVAPNVAPAPVVDDHAPFADAPENPQFNPIHTYHLGLWFNSPADAQNAGLPGTVTPFNGDHNAGVQVLSTRNFPADAGPLRQLVP